MSENYLVLKRKGEAPLPSYIKRRLTKENKNFLQIISGSTGSGKTYFSMVEGLQIDPDFNIDYVVFSFEELMRLCTNAEFLKKKYKVIIFEEAQISQGSANWQSKENKLANMFFSTFRHLNICIIFTTPFMDFVDAKSRKMIHMEIKMERIMRKEKKSIGIPRFLQWNEHMKKFYYHKLRVIIPPSKGAFPLDKMAMSLPPKELIDAYEKKKTSFTSDLNQQILDQLEALKEAKKPLVIDKRKRLTPLQEDVFTAWASGLAMNVIALEFKCTPQAISKYIRACELKGYSKKEFEISTINKSPQQTIPARHI